MARTATQDVELWKNTALCRTAAPGPDHAAFALQPTIAAPPEAVATLAMPLFSIPPNPSCPCPDIPTPSVARSRPRRSRVQQPQASSSTTTGPHHHPYGLRVPLQIDMPPSLAGWLGGAHHAPPCLAPQLGHGLSLPGLHSRRFFPAKSGGVLQPKLRSRRVRRSAMAARTARAGHRGGTTHSMLSDHGSRIHAVGPQHEEGRERRQRPPELN